MIGSVVGEVMATIAGIIAATAGAWVAITKQRTSAVQTDREHVDRQVAAAVAAERKHCDDRLDTMQLLIGEVKAKVAELEAELRSQERDVSRADARAWEMRELALLAGADQAVVVRVWDEAARRLD